MKERIIGKCPVCSLPGCFLSKTKTEKEYSYFGSQCQHRGFIPVADVALFQIEGVKDEIMETVNRKGGGKNERRTDQIEPGREDIAGSGETPRPAREDEQVRGEPSELDTVLSRILSR